MTEKLFYLDSHLQRFSAQVEQCVPDGENWQIVLDRTAFFRKGEDSMRIQGYLAVRECWMCRKGWCDFSQDRCASFGWRLCRGKD